MAQRDNRGKFIKGERLEKVCVTCGSKFLVIPSRKNAKYCKRSCYISDKEKLRKQSEFLKSYISENGVWNKGKTYKTKVISVKIKKNCLYCGKEFMSYLSEKQMFCGNECAHKGRNFTPWNKGTATHSYLCECGNKKAYLSKQCRKCYLKNRVFSRETIRKMLCRRELSSLEKRVNNIILKNRLPYVFTGNGKFFIERKNPDFVNINGEKIAVEVYSRRHKEKFRGGINKWREDRLRVFSKYGWRLLFIEDWQTNDEQAVVNILSGGGIST